MMTMLTCGYDGDDNDDNDNDDDDDDDDDNYDDSDFECDCIHWLLGRRSCLKYCNDDDKEDDNDDDICHNDCSNFDCDCSHRFIGTQKLSEMLQQPYDLFKPGWADHYILGMVNQVNIWMTNIFVLDDQYILIG